MRAMCSEICLPSTQDTLSTRVTLKESHQECQESRLYLKYLSYHYISSKLCDSSSLYRPLTRFYFILQITTYNANVQLLLVV